jgi:hypothetical protein
LMFCHFIMPCLVVDLISSTRPCIWHALLVWKFMSFSFEKCPWILSSLLSLRTCFKVELSNEEGHKVTWDVHSQAPTLEFLP